MVVSGQWHSLRDGWLWSGVVGGISRCKYGLTFGEPVLLYSS